MNGRRILLCFCNGAGLFAAALLMSACMTRIEPYPNLQIRPALPPPSVNITPANESTIKTLANRLEDHVQAAFNAERNVRRAPIQFHASADPIHQD